MHMHAQIKVCCLIMLLDVRRKTAINADVLLNQITV